MHLLSRAGNITRRIPDVLFLLAFLGVGAWIPSVYAEGAEQDKTGEETEGKSPVAFELQAGSEFPVSLGARGLLHIPYGFRFGFGMGFMPTGYVEIIDSIAEGFELYTAQDSKLIEAALGNAMVMDFQLGWDPFEPGGFFLDAGYNLVILGGTKTAAQLIEDASGVDLYFIPNDIKVSLSSRVHNATFHVGYIFQVTPHWTLTLALGVLKSFYSSTEVSFPLQGQRAEQAGQAISNYLNEIFQRYVVTLTASVWAGYRF